MWKEDWECGFLQNDYDELKSLIEEMGGFEGVEDEAVNYYFSMCNY